MTSLTYAYTPAEVVTPGALQVEVFWGMKEEKEAASRRHLLG